MWFFATPVIWRADMIRSKFPWLVDWNPMAHVLASYRNVLMYGKPPHVGPLLVIAVASCALLVAMTAYYSRCEHRIVKAL